MDIEQLSKSQTVLLTLLVSFVTSIATGIVTVSLMDQAPPSIAQTVNRVIERTVQQVVPADQSAAAAVTQEKTVIVKESDLVSQAVGRVSPSIVRLYAASADAPIFLGLGVVVEASGTIATDAAALGDSSDIIAELSAASHVRVAISRQSADTGLAFLSASTTTNAEGKPLVWTPITVSAQNPTLGESVVMMAGKTVARIADGIITSIIPSGSLQVIDTSILADSIMAGSPLIDTNGTLVGISTSAARAASLTGFLSASALTTPPADPVASGSDGQ